MLTQKNRSGAFILSDDEFLSRDEITVVSGAGVLEAGQVLGKIQASGKFTKYDAGASNGSEVAVGVLYSHVDASEEDAKGLAVVRMAAVKEDFLVGLDADAQEHLAANYVMVR